jgi:hypothetical protein
MLILHSPHSTILIIHLVSTASLVFIFLARQRSTILKVLYFPQTLIESDSRQDWEASPKLHRSIRKIYVFLRTIVLILLLFFHLRKNFEGWNCFILSSFHLQLILLVLKIYQIKGILLYLKAFNCHHNLPVSVFGQNIYFIAHSQPTRHPPFELGYI